MSSIENSNFMIDHLATLDLFETFDERCNYILCLIDHDYPFALEEQPEAWIQRLISMKEANPKIIVSIIKKIFGKDFICVEASEISGYQIFLVDTLGMFLDEIQDVEFENRIKIENNIINTMILLQSNM